MQILILSKVVSYDNVIIHTGEKIYFILSPLTTFTKFCVTVTRYQGLFLLMMDVVRMHLQHADFIRFEDY